MGLARLAGCRVREKEAAVAFPGVFGDEDDSNRGATEDTKKTISQRADRQVRGKVKEGDDDG